MYRMRLLLRLRRGALGDDFNFFFFFCTSQQPDPTYARCYNMIRVGITKTVDLVTEKDRESKSSR